MKKFLFVAVLAALPAAGCIQTMPDGSIAAAPTTASLLAPQSYDGPPPQHQVRDGNRIIAADPDPSIRATLVRDTCQTLNADRGTCGGGSD